MNDTTIFANHFFLSKTQFIKLHS